MSDQPICIGMAGAGFISHYHIQGLQDASAQVTSIYSYTLANAQSRAAEYGIENATDQFDDLLNDSAIGAIVIATPDFTHEDMTIRALRAGKPVLLQKPMGRNVAECQAMIDVMNQSGVPLYVSFMHRYLEEIEVLKELLHHKALGQVNSIRQRNATPGADWASWFYQKENVGGGVLLQLGVHGIDLLRYVFGEITQVRATTELLVRERLLADGTIVKPDAEDFVVATYRFESGAIGVHECSYAEVAGTNRFRMEVYGDKGTAWLRSERGRLALYAPQHIGYQGWFTPDITTEQIGYRQHRHFIQMLNGTAPPDNSAHDGLRSIQVAEAVYRSATSQAWEEVKRS